MMLPIEELKTQKIGKVAGGHLVLYPYGNELLFALRVEALRPQAKDNVGLLVFGLSIDQYRYGALLFDTSDLEREACLHIGQARGAWNGKVESSIARASRGDISTVDLMVHAGSIAVAGMHGAHAQHRGYWSLASGFSCASGISAYRTSTGSSKRF